MGQYKPRIRKNRTFFYTMPVNLIPNSNFRFVNFCGLMLEKSPPSLTGAVAPHFL